MKKIIEIITCKGFKNFVKLCIYDYNRYNQEDDEIEDFLEYESKTFEESMAKAKEYLESNYKNIKLKNSYVNSIGNTVEIYFAEVK